MAEAGYPGIGSLNWNGVFVRAGTPKPVIAKLHREIVAAMKELDAEGMLTKRAIPLSISESPAEFDAICAVGKQALAENHPGQQRQNRLGPS